jgi:hypothetical protein
VEQRPTLVRRHAVNVPPLLRELIPHALRSRLSPTAYFEPA